MQGAVNRCVKAIKKGPRHCRVNEDSERLEFRRVQDSDVVNHTTRTRTVREETNDKVRQRGPSSSTGEVATPAGSQRPPVEVTPPPVAKAKPGPPIDLTGADKKEDGKNGPGKKRGTKGPGKGKGQGKGKGKVSPNKDGKGKGKARPKMKALTTASVLKKAKDCTMEYSSVIQKSRNLITQIEDPNICRYRGLDTDRFKGRLATKITKTEEKMAQYTDLHDLMLYNTPLPESWSSDLHGSMAAIEDVKSFVDALEALFQRILLLNEEDQPSQ